jgi:hypothetical protein
MIDMESMFGRLFDSSITLLHSCEQEMTRSTIMNTFRHADEAAEAPSAHQHSRRCERRGAMNMISGVWFSTRTLQDDTSMTDVMDRITVSTVPSSPPRKRALEEIQVRATDVYGCTDGMAHIAALGTSGSVERNLIPVR